MEGRQNRPQSEKKGGKKQKTQEEHYKVGEGKKDKQQKYLQNIGSLPEGGGEV